MKKTKKMMGLIIIFIALFMQINIVKAEDELTVTVDNNSFEVINNNVTVGDEVTIKVAITSNANKPLESVIVYFTKPVTKANTQSYDLIYNSTSGLYEGKIKIDNTWQNGNYIIERMWFYDGVQSTSRYNSKNPNALWYGSSNYHSVDLSGCSFTVYGTTADAELPAIIGSSLSLSERKTIVGDTVKYEVEITDNVAIKNASIQLYWESGSEMDFETIDLVYNSNTGLYEGYFTITEETVVGTWYVRYIRATDTNNNTKYLYNSVVSMGTYEYAWSSSIYTIRNYGTNPDSKLTISSLSIDDTSIIAGETVNISLEAMNYFGISDVKLYYKKDNNDELYMIEALFDKTNSTVSSNGLSWYYNKYVASVTFNDYGYNGKWTLDKIEIISDRNNITTIYNNELHENSETNLSALNFETVGLIDDQNSPTIIDYIIDKDYVYYNDKVKLTINASDDLSGIQNIVANYTLPDGTNKDYILELSDDLYKYEFNYDNQDLNGRYKINYLLAKDKAGNITKITENISQLSFDFNNTITIISPTLYPDMTTSYTLKAYVADNLEIENVVWSSSNTSIASINATTGVMSTKYNSGKVVITATANDGSGLYGSIELFVTGAKVAVGQTISLGNSNYVNYSSVIWEIEDESILSKTGKSGYISINNNYKHNIEVKGVKAGHTTLSMLTPSGDILVSSNVYVYDAISNISSETKTLTLEKGKKATISANATYYSDITSSDEIYYYSDNKSVVKIDQRGNVTAIESGTANIIIYSKNSGVNLKIPVTVIVYSESIEVDSENIVLNEENKTHQILYTVLPDDASNKNVTFKSNNEKIVTVTDSGIIQAIGNGTAIITINTDDNNSKKEIFVTVDGLKKDITLLQYENCGKFTYTGNNIEPEFVIKDDDYYLLEGKDYTVEYFNNINVGTAVAVITGINNYKNSKSLEYYIGIANPNIEYSASDKVVEYDEQNHGINLTITSPSNVIVKYANSAGEYVLDEMPTYTLPGKYIINYKLSINENYSVIISWNELIINPSTNYNIVFKGNGATSGSMTNQNDLLHSKIYKLNTNKFKRKGYTFVEWNTKADGSGISYSDGAEIKGLSNENGTTVTLYARWKKVKYTLTYELNGGTNSSSNKTSYYLTSSTFKLYSPTRKGYTFKGWYLDSGYKTKVTEIKKGTTGNKTLYAKWAVNKYAITFKGNGATSGSMSKQSSLSYNKTYKLNANKFKRKGYTFVEWNTKPDGSGKSYSNKAEIKNLSSKNGGTITLYARWKKVKYTLTYKLNGGTNSSSNKTNYYVTTSTFKLLSPTKKGYTFKGWYLDSSYKTKATEIKKGTTGNKTLYAKWAVNKYAITFKGNGATSGSMSKQSSLSYNKTYKLNASKFKRKGYTFVEWNTKSDGSGKSYSNKAEIKNLSSKNGGKVTLYARWKKVKYTLTYKLNGGTNSSSNKTNYYVTTSTFKLLSPTRTGYTFKGWYLDSKFKTKVTEIKKGTTGNKTLYAKWSTKSYNITYKLNGGTNGNNPYTYRITTATVDLKSPARTGYTFAGWYTDAEFNNKIEKIEKGTYGNKTLYAKWMANKYIVAFNDNGSSAGSYISEITCTYNKNCTLPYSVYEKQGYTFIGWNTKADGTGKKYAEGATVKNITSKNGKTIILYAVWKKETSIPN